MNWLRKKITTWRLRRWYRQEYLTNAHLVRVLDEEA